MPFSPPMHRMAPNNSAGGRSWLVNPTNRVVSKRKAGVALSGAEHSETGQMGSAVCLSDALSCTQLWGHSGVPTGIHPVDETQEAHFQRPKCPRALKEALWKEKKFCWAQKKKLNKTSPQRVPGKARDRDQGSKTSYLMAP